MSRTERPSKLCPVCERPFQWRARWRLNWEQVRYCSRRCASNRHTIKTQVPAAAAAPDHPRRR
ncbi:MAG: DUF2256 domain-containing protein [Halieaceae bacterium]|uniref:DUF2256 domain-containing protein n=1 Tax=Haliea alexandrii TaxID=2448162 RepID=UPI000F0BB080|nr:DUF2256 domain-containing protein [Haliea alexandrii]MCR9186681.1 DUF2256 domain-containing protein [Halieaceae bacterium]